MNRYSAMSFCCLLLASPALLAAEVNKTKELGEEKQAISFFSAMCLQTGGSTERIEKQLGKASTQIDKKTLLYGNYTMEQTEDVWTVPSSVANNPYILSVTKTGVCFAGFNASDPIKLRQEFKKFATEQAENINSKLEAKEPDLDIPAELQVDFYDIKIPDTTHVIKFSLAVPKDADSSRRSTMTIASE